MKNVTSISPPFRHKRRTYLHFDLPISTTAAKHLACDERSVAQHPFYPFLGYTIEFTRITREKGGLLIKKKKKREIKIAAHKDAAIYARYADILSPAYESALRDRSLGSIVTAFRQIKNGGTNIEFAGEIFEFIDQHRPCCALAFDLEKFFDTLDHKLLKEKWKQVIQKDRLPDDHFAVYSSLTQYSWVERDKVFKTLKISRHNPKAKGRLRICKPKDYREKIRESGLLQPNPTPGKGIPQGSPISALLSNIYMLDFDESLNTTISRLGGIYRRYCDDIMIVVSCEYRQEAEAAVAKAVSVAKLAFNEDKTDRVEFPEGSRQLALRPQPNSGFGERIQYLGFIFDGTRTLIRPGSLARYYAKMRAGVRLAKNTRVKYNKQEIAKQKPVSALRTRKLFIQYSYLIRRRTRLPDRDVKAQGNFLTYAYKAAKKLNALHIKIQVRNHWKKLLTEINKPIPVSCVPPNK